MRSELGNQVETPQVDPNNPNGDPNAPGGALNQPAGSNLPFDAGANPQQPGANGQGTGTGTGTGTGDAPQGFGQLTNQPANTGVTNNALSNDIRQTPGMRNRVLGFTPTAAATSPQYRALQERLKRRHSNSAMAETEANQQFRAQQRAMEEAAQGGGRSPDSRANPAATQTRRLEMHFPTLQVPRCSRAVLCNRAARWRQVDKRSRAA